MRIVMFGVTGMVGQGALRECLRDPEVEQVVSIVRTASEMRHWKLQEIVHAGFLDFSPIANRLANLGACIYCLGVTSTGISEEAYTRITHGFAISAAKTLLQNNPDMTFVFISGAGADSSERGRVMWARVKGKTENELLAMPFQAVYIFRPGFIQPLDGIQSKTASYRMLYKLTSPLLTLFRRLFPSYISTTEELGQALLFAAKRGREKRVVEASQIRSLLLQLRAEPPRQQE